MFIENESNLEFFYFYTVSEHFHFQSLLEMNPIQNKRVRNYDVRMREISPRSGKCDKPTSGNT